MMSFGYAKEHEGKQMAMAAIWDWESFIISVEERGNECGCCRERERERECVYGPRDEGEVVGEGASKTSWCEVQSGRRMLPMLL